METLDKSPITLHEFISGLLAGCVLRGQQTLVQNDRLDRCAARAYDTLHTKATEWGHTLDFRIKLHPIHQDSLTFHEAMQRAVLAGFVRFGSPDTTTIYLTMSEEWAQDLINRLPGDEAFWLSLADDFRLGV